MSDETTSAGIQAGSSSDPPCASEPELECLVARIFEIGTLILCSKLQISNCTFSRTSSKIGGFVSHVEEAVSSALTIEVLGCLFRNSKGVIRSFDDSNETGLAEPQKKT